MTAASAPKNSDPTKPELPPVVPAKPGVLAPWFLMAVVLMISFGLHLMLDPVSEAIERVGIIKDLIVPAFPEFLQGLAGEFFSWAVSLGLQTPYGSVAGLMFTLVFMVCFVRPLVVTLVSATLTHALLLLTGGTAGGWRVTFRAFALNRIFVELLTLVVLLVVAYSSLPVSFQVLLLLILIPGIRLIGMGTLLAQVVRGQDVNFFRTLFLLGPLFALTTILGMLLSIVDVLWVGLWCVAHVR
jgi:hypothetical protein